MILQRNVIVMACFMVGIFVVFYSYCSRHRSTCRQVEVKIKLEVFVSTMLARITPVKFEEDKEVASVAIRNRN